MVVALSCSARDRTAASTSRLWANCPRSRSTSRRCATVSDLPDAARRYAEFVERALDVEIALIGTGAERTSVLTRA